MNTPNTEPDPATLYANFNKSEQDRARIYNRAVLKSLDLADDEMKVETNVDRSTKGVGPGGLALVAAAAGLPAAAALALAAAQYFGTPDPTPPPPVTPPITQPAPVDTDSGLFLLDERPLR